MALGAWHCVCFRCSLFVGPRYSQWLFTEFCLSNNVCVRVYNQSRIQEMIDQRGEPEFMDPPANAFYKVNPSYIALSSGVSYAAK